MAVYLLANVVGIGLGVYKVNAMGLLPTSQSDWLEFMLVREVCLICPHVITFVSPLPS